MEYMGAGKPIVATRVGGLPEMIEHEVHGLLFEPRDAPGLAGALGELIGEPARARAMGERGRTRQQHRFDLETTVRNLEDLYEMLYLHSDRGRRERWRPLPRTVVPENT